jgi:hypothetical protein
MNPPCAECGDVCACGEYLPLNMPRGRPPEDDVARSRMIRVRATPDQETRWRVAAGVGYGGCRCVGQRPGIVYHPPDR